MKNPWEEISLTDYESHMQLDSVMQLQVLNEMMIGPILYISRVKYNDIWYCRWQRS